MCTTCGYLALFVRPRTGWPVIEATPIVSNPVVVSGERVEISEKLFGPLDGQWEPDAERIARLGDGAARVTALVARSAPKRLRLSRFHRRQPREVGVAAIPSGNRSRPLGDRARRLGQTGQGRAAGTIWLRPRRRVSVEGYGGRWSGDWYLAEVRHQFDLRDRTYVSSFTCTR